jgi:glycosyltransferase involved in cell wall biosynthesis
MGDIKKPAISVIICTHNPRMDYLKRALEALKCQTFPLDRWELLIVDNASTQVPVIDLEWHPLSRTIREEKLGLTQARWRGITEAKGDLLVFVDDDNVLNTGYLEQANKIASEWLKLGAWSGRVVPEYETIPGKELKPYLWMLCIRPIEKDSWGNEGSFDSTPWGAGMCVRKFVALRYVEEIRNDEFRASLDRRGDSLGSTGDIDLALTSLNLGFGTGVFKNLELLHIIAARRLKEDYLLKLIEDGEAGYLLFQTARGKKPVHAKSRIDRIVEFYKRMRGSRFEKAIALARSRGRKRGEAMLEFTKNVIANRI